MANVTALSATGSEREVRRANEQCSNTLAVRRLTAPYFQVYFRPKLSEIHLCQQKVSIIGCFTNYVLMIASKIDHNIPRNALYLALKFRIEE